VAIPLVFVDATVIFSRTHRDWLLAARTVTAGGMFALQSSEDVLNEALARLRDANPRWDGGVFAKVRRNVYDVFDDVLSEFPGDVDWPGIDDGDIHVHAAALHGGASMLLTSDNGLLSLADLPDVPYEPVSPDEFFTLVDDSNQRAVREMVQLQLAYYETRGEKAELAERLRRANCPTFAYRIEERISEVAGTRAHRAFLAQRRASED
jgi:hypothetical protein